MTSRRGVRLRVAKIGLGLSGLAAIAALLTLLVVVAVVVVGAALVALVGFGGTKPRLGSPGKGTASAHYPVQVAPASGLTDGALVFVTSTAFTSDQIVGVTVCLTEAATRHVGVDACDTTSGARYAVRDGRLAAGYRVPRVVTIGGTAYDCASRPGRCLIVAADASNFDRSGGVAVSFSSGLPAARLVPSGARPQSDHLPARRAPEGPVPADSQVTVRAQGFQPGEPVLVAWCTPRFELVGPTGCSPRDASAAMSAVMFRSTKGITEHADEAGAFTTAVRVPRWIVAYDGAARRDPACSTAPGACSIVIAAAADTKRSAVVPLTVQP
ncbi:MAG: hypothetical protein JWN46_64 [Acidimicrobiales bacterium]|nr:hypothetical protein [Acidimicrobiales bacterium]